MSRQHLPRLLRRPSALLGAALLAPCLALPALAAPGSATFEVPPPPSWLRPLKDDTSNPLVLEAGRRLRDKLWRPLPAEAQARHAQRLPLNTLVNEDRGNITVVRGDAGELDVNWEDPQSLQDALLNIIQSYYDNHPQSNPHFITVMTTFQVQSVAAFYMPLSNDVRGIGYQHSGEGQEIFSYVPPQLALDGIIFMNSYRSYNGVYAPLGRLTFNQELGHRWGAHVAFQGRAGDSMELLGRDCSHWSFFTDTQNSAMEGNAWSDNGNGTFSTTTSFYSFGYSHLDRYLMGFIPAEAVPPFFYVSGAGGWDCAQTYRQGELNPRHYPPIFGGAGQDQVTVSGSRVNVTVDDVIAAEGRRNPDADSARHTWTMAFILAARRNDTINDRALQQTDELRTTWERDWERDAVEGDYDPPDLITSVDGSNQPPPEPQPSGNAVGGPCAAFSDCDPTQTDRCVGTNAGVGVCTKLCEAPSDCPTDFCCVPTVPGPRQDRYDWYCLHKTGEVCEDYSNPPEPDAAPAPAEPDGGPSVEGDGGPSPTDDASLSQGDAAIGADDAAPTGATQVKSGGGSSGCQVVAPGARTGGGLAVLAGLLALSAAGRRRRR